MMSPQISHEPHRILPNQRTRCRQVHEALGTLKEAGLTDVKDDPGAAESQKPRCEHLLRSSPVA